MKVIKPKVFVTRKLPELVEARMMELFDTKLNNSDRPLSDKDLIDVLNNFEIVVPSVSDNLRANILSQSGKRLRLLANFGAGVDHIDLEIANNKNIIITNTPGVLTEDTADMVMSLILSVPRRLSEGEQLVRSGKWTGWSPTHMMGRRIWGKRLGIIGMGRIGQAVARRARGFGISIHYNNRNRLPEIIEDSLEATYWENLEQMIARMDIISINCPLTDETYQLLSKKRLELFSLKNNFDPGKPLILHDEPIYRMDKIIGYTTSANYSFYYKKSILLAYITCNSEKYDNLTIEVAGNNYELHHEKNAIHDPKSIKLRG